MAVCMDNEDGNETMAEKGASWLACSQSFEQNRNNRTIIFVFKCLRMSHIISGMPSHLSTDPCGKIDHTKNFNKSKWNSLE